MRLFLNVCTLSALLLPLPVSAQAAQFGPTITLSVAGKDYVVKDLPQFADYPAAKASSKRAVDIDWSSHKGAWEYRTRLRKGLEQGADFNGHYKVVSHGCGSGCQGNWIVDVETGRVVEQFYTSLGTLYRKDSALLIADPLVEFERQGIEDVAELRDRKVIFYTVKKEHLREVQVLNLQQEILDQMGKR